MASNPSSSRKNKGKRTANVESPNQSPNMPNLNSPSTPCTPPFRPQNMGGFVDYINMSPWDINMGSGGPGGGGFGPGYQMHQFPLQMYGSPSDFSTQSSQTSGSSQECNQSPYPQMPNPQMPNPQMPHPQMPSSNTQIPETQIPNFSEWCTEEELVNSKRKSSVWGHFHLSRDGTKAKCKTCNKIYTADTKGGTGHLSRHVRKCGGPSMDPSQPKLSAFHPQGFTYNYERDRDELGKMLVHAEQPFLFAENDAFNQYITTALQPQHKKIGRRTARSSAMKKYQQAKLALQNELENLTSRVSLTADAWDGSYGIHYLCVTCHWVDSSWILQKRIIHFKMLEYPHTGLNIAHHLMQAIDAYSLRPKIMSMTFDNATSMTYSANLVRQQLPELLLDGDALHIRCACHVLNLCVKDGQEAIGPYYHKIRNAIMCISSSNMRLQEWRGFCRQQRIKAVKIAPDCTTRWNSTYDMLSRAIEYKTPLTVFYNQKFPQNALIDSDWQICEKYMQFLQLLYNMTHCFSSVYNPCAHSFLTNACLIAQLFFDHRYEHEYDGYLPAMEEKWRKYFTTIPLIYVFASILDPRQKYEGTFLLIDIYFKCMDLEDDVTAYKTKVTDQFFSLYRVYESKYGSVTRSGPSQTSQQVSKRTKGLFAQAANMMSKFSAAGDSSGRRSQSDVSELQMYLNYDFMKGVDEEEKFGLDILDWWKSQSNKHPILAAMARDILAIQVSSVASERAFSASGRVLDDRRSSLKPDTLEMCVCFKDWLDAENRSQDRSFDRNDNDEGTSTSTSTSSQPIQLADELEGGDDQDEDEDEDV